MARMTRRQFLSTAAALAVGAAVTKPAEALAALARGTTTTTTTGGMGGGMMGGGMMGGGMMGGGMGGGGMGGGGMMGGGVVDPPVGAAYRDPVTLTNASKTPGVVEVALDARMAPINVNGTTANLMTYNGLFPGGTIRARTSDLLRVKFSNSLPSDGATNFLGHPKYMTNLHTHGLHVTPGDNPDPVTPPMMPFTPGSHGDNMLVMLEPGESTLYEYDLSKHYPGTLNFYHPHIHGSVSDQMWAGMSGCLVVEDQVSALEQLRDPHHDAQGHHPLGLRTRPRTPRRWTTCTGSRASTVMVNGQVNPRLHHKARAGAALAHRQCLHRPVLPAEPLRPHHVPGGNRGRPARQALRDHRGAALPRGARRPAHQGRQDHGFLQVPQPARTAGWG